MKNLRSVLMNVALVLIGVLALVFMSQAFYGAGAGALSGYNFLKFEKSAFIPNEVILVKASVIISIIVLSIMILVAIVNLLANLNVIKNSKVAKVLNILNVVLTVVFAIFAVCALAAVASLITDSVKMGWAVIVNLILAVVAVVVAVIQLVGANKKK